MSPDPSVHDEQLEEIERDYGRPLVRRRRRSGCVLFLIFLLLALLGGILWFERDLLLQDGEIELGNLKERLTERKEALNGEDASEMLERLQSKVEDLQNRLEGVAESEDIRGRLESLREDLAKKKAAGSRSLQKGWSELAGKSQDLLDKVKEKGKEAPKELEELMTMLKNLSDAEKKLSGETDSDNKSE